MQTESGGRMSADRITEAVDNFGLLPCPLCGGRALFHGHKDDPECHGCHHIECTACKAMFDLGVAADPGNECVALTQLRRKCAEVWNRRALTASEKQRDAARQELSNIALAKRYDPKCFSDDKEFGDWAQSRCRHTLGETK
jgi:hypothetical protein